MLRAAIAIAVGLTTVPAYAQVLKCLDADGKVEYRSSPCPAGAVDAQNRTDETSAGVRRRTENSTERKRALDAAERHAAVARAARPQTHVQALPPPPGK